MPSVNDILPRRGTWQGGVPPQMGIRYLILSCIFTVDM